MCVLVCLFLRQGPAPIYLACPSTSNILFVSFFFFFFCSLVSSPSPFLASPHLLLSIEASEVTIRHIDPLCPTSEDLSLELLQY